MICPWLKSQLLFFIGLVAWVADIGLAADKPGVVLSGSYEFSSYAKNAPLRHSYNFEAAIYDCSWIITCEGPTSSSDPKPRVKRKWMESCDGANIYKVQFWSEEEGKNAFGDRYASVKDQLPVATAEIFPGAFPPCELALRDIWFAFASACLTRGPSGLMKGLGGEDLALFYSTNCYLKYYWTNSPTEPGARQIVLESDGHYFGRDCGNSKVLLGRFAPPFDKGFTWGIGEYHKWTNMAGIFVPLEFEFTSFTTKLDAKLPSDLEKWNGYKCTVSAFRSSAMQRIPPDLPKGKVDVTDRRFFQDGLATVNYAVTDGRWLAADHPSLLKLAAHTRKVPLETEQGFGARSGSHVKKYIIWCFMLLPLSVLALKGLSDKLKTKGIT